MLRKIFNWKVFSVLYAIFFMILGIFTFATFDKNDILLPNVETILNMLGAFVEVTGVSYCFAKGWKVQLFSKKFSIVYAIVTVLFFPAIFLYFCLYFPVMMDFDLFSGVIASAVTVALQIILILPAIVAYFMYFAEYKEYSSIKKGVHKILACAVCADAFCTLVALIFFKYQNLFKYNAFDYYGLFMSLLVLPLIVFYAWDIKAANQKLWKSFTILYVLSEILSYLYMSSQYKYDFDIFSSVTNILVLLAIIGYTLFVLYRYSFTDEIFGNEQN